MTEIRSYTRLISDCAHYDVASVEALHAAEQEAKTKATQE